MGTDSQSNANLLMMKNHTQFGFSIVEIMISMTLGLLLLTAVGAFYVAHSRNQRELDNQFVQIENGRYAMDVLSKYVQIAGYYGRYTYMDDFPDASATMPSACETNPQYMYTTASGTNALAFAVFGAVSATMSSAFTCLPSANLYSDNDAFLVREVDPTPIASGALVARNVYLQGVARLRDPVIATGSNAASFNLTNLDGSAGDIQRFLARTFYIGRCVDTSGTTCVSGSDAPTLRMLELGDTGVATGYTDTPLVEGIERMVIEYGLDMAGSNHTVTNASGINIVVQYDGAPDTYTRTPSTTDQWARVVALRITLLARSNVITAGYTDSNVYTLASGVTYTPTGNAAKYKHKLFRKTIYLNNVGARRR
ncbi:PilW family protein [Vogesella sp. LIG4]|uniref:PilW family protein n=1 Tax=Vogesella sp. LIG4 TaxID=1192162 RepID=UPI00081F9D35|nr:PilW family protein [Vogesella sp. LIG4]SCK31048.1 type IV pilus assembly protein PilW [Vogesella sp. LIG4]